MPQSIKKQLEIALEALEKSQEQQIIALALIKQARQEINAYRRSRIGLMPELLADKEPED